MTWLSPAIWLNPLLTVLLTGQHAAEHAAHFLGLAGDSHGQAAWPWSQRLATETLRIDAGTARDLLEACVATGAAVLLALVAIVWRSARVILLLGAGLTAWWAPWPAQSVWLTDAVPTSFQETAFSTVSIAQGARVYAEHCAGCHGADGRGAGPLAPTLTRWPPTVVGPLLGHRLDGEMFWHILYGMRDFRGTRTMPGFAGTLSDGDAWATLNYMKVLAAGGGAQSGAGWPVPVALPDLDVRCPNEIAQPLARWRSGQRVRVVALAPGAQPPLEDPRWQTLVLTPDDAATETTNAESWARARRAACVAATPGAWAAFAGIAGFADNRFAGTQLLADRNGWLRAEAKPGDAGWAGATLLCTANGNGAAGEANLGADPVSALLRQMDTQPVRYVKGGYVH